MADTGIQQPTIRIGQVETPVSDPHSIVPVSCEVITDLRLIDGVLFLSPASHISDGSGPAEARVVARLRIPMSVVAAINAGIEQAHANVEQAKKAAN